MMYSALDVAHILQSDPQLLSDKDAMISYLTMDTRKIEKPSQTIFFALSGSMHDGHDFIHEALDKGIKSIVVEKNPGFLSGHINVFIVKNSLKAMQILAAYHRSKFPDLAVIGITGSNGKTTIKEWLYQMIHDRQVVKSPKSYNSQTGVALSVWQIKEGDELGIFEAGISQPNEMQALAEMIKPGIGLFTLLGDAHAEGFSNLAEKLNEKLVLFKDCHTIIFEEDDLIVSMAIREKFDDKKLLSWGWNQNATLFRIAEIQKSNYQTKVTIIYKNIEEEFIIPFSDTASIENAMHCIAVLMYLEFSLTDIRDGLHKLQNIPMRLEMKNGIYSSILVNDTYNADIQSFKIALEFLTQQAGAKEKVVIVSDFLQTGLDIDALNNQLSNLIHQHNISHVIGVGSKVSQLEKFLDPFILFTSASSTDELIRKLPEINVSHKAILVKGARTFQLEKVINALSDKAHTATLETDMQAIEHNLKIFSQQLTPGTQIIAVIKASAYGSGSEELARFLEFKKVGYLAVAFIDEGVQLRKAGILLPVIILNPDRNGVVDMMKYELEPEVYSIEQLKEIASLIATDGLQNFNLHIKLDTGMHRLGFMEADLVELCDILREHKSQLIVKSIFSHLSSSEDPGDDDYTHTQAEKLNSSYRYIVSKIGYAPAKHILNSSGIIRFPEYHFDLVRLGLGLYGLDSTNTIGNKLEKVHTLKATVVQIKYITKEDTVGYNRKGKPIANGKIAIINIGYADGLMRLAGNNRYSVRIHGKDYPIIGNVCMDLTIIDIGEAENIFVGDEAIIFGKDKPVESLAEVCQTIPYEILSRISSRVRRLYVQG
ncbi:MAG: bifunctional UDP-N-acetylmuramoyl-tripeptide:D-alanyl-D-alanine ligase/alanine racemase [Saprospiraceae bacterium]|nr:bifunctional UDP-N-acetylmuramoyl-tripeptide:D-alanyl-D-alanine ligase/alanine racemase [Saprospiraceae bacterium]MBK8670201.1 bifunctional UDP-N-acetylmuramoyl-tripeptide:D-alanyl-D-alanine ligase/alanine racemase [Saprospiraceae bacterium]